jgi:serine-type D-Ala-D-Ala endopeptidase (penicillin-binding protein 7)
MRNRRWQGLAAWLATVAAGLVLGLGGPAPADAAQSRASASKSAVKTAKASTKAKSSRKVRKTSVSRRAAAPAKVSFGHQAGLHSTDDPLNLRSSVALVMDPATNEVLFSKNSDAVLPIASITKLMTALVVLHAGQPLDEELLITQDDVDTHKGSSSRLRVGTRLTRGEMLHLALMSSENRAANALGRHYPGGLKAFVSAMNAKAQLIGMSDSRFADPTGLLSANQSTAHDLALLVRASSTEPLIRELSTARETEVAVGRRQLQYRNSNALVRDPDWDIIVQKTGYISEAGRCVVMQAEMAGRKLIMVLLDSAGSYGRTLDAQRLRSWLASDALPQPR